MALQTVEEFETTKFATMETKEVSIEDLRKEAKVQRESVKFSSMSMTDLKARAKKAKVAKYTTMNKSDLIKAVKKLITLEIKNGIRAQ